MISDTCVNSDIFISICGRDAFITYQTYYQTKEVLRNKKFKILKINIKIINYLTNKFSTRESVSKNY